MPLPQHQPPQSHAYASPVSRACPSQPPCRFDTKVESQNRLSENPADSANCENALADLIRFRTKQKICIDCGREGHCPSRPLFVVGDAPQHGEGPGRRADAKWRSLRMAVRIPDAF